VSENDSAIKLRNSAEKARTQAIYAGMLLAFFLAGVTLDFIGASYSSTSANGRIFLIFFALTVLVVCLPAALVQFIGKVSVYLRALSAEKVEESANELTPISQR
jgi:hypothetical protein